MKTIMMLTVVATFALTGAWIAGTARAARLRHDSVSGFYAEGDLAAPAVAPIAADPLATLKSLAAECAAAAAKLRPAQRPSRERRRRAFASGDRSGPPSGARAAPWRISAN